MIYLKRLLQRFWPSSCHPHKQKYSRLHTPHHPLIGMAFHQTVYFLLLATVLKALALDTTLTTLQPVFTFPADGTSTIYESTTTESSAVDCSGSSLVVVTFPVSDIGPGVGNLMTASTSGAHIGLGSNEHSYCHFSGHNLV